ncbi:uncharacterized protein K02A2.6-like [Lytechinus variegatus]|uniref:uncharacterized protein K02A2.6-like n=1 Tax=Lytechinus variegatus TaxID=7654 RepID=UPI001BB1F71C|nr:uncharacterized protein K02A2.6-like [Lytechinus variegatus]
MVTKLRKAAQGCNYGADEDNQIRDQVVQNCRSNNLRRKLLEKGQTLTLAETLVIAKSFEAVEAQFQSMKLDGRSSGGQVNQLTTSSGKTSRGKSSRNAESGHECYRCGNLGHFGSDASCPAKGKTCRSCGGHDHFAKKCKSKSKKKSKWGSEKKDKERSGTSSGYKSKKGRGRVRHVEGNSSSDDEAVAECDCKHKVRNEKNYQFAVYGITSQHEKVDLIIGGVTVPVIVDSGSDSNVIDKLLWEKLKSKRIVCTSRRCSRKLYPYASKVPLHTIGCFTTLVEVGGRKVEAEFTVIEEEGEPLLSKSTAKELGILQIGVQSAQVNSVMQSYEDLKSEFDGVFHGVGKLKGRQVRLAVNETVKPIAQPVRRTPFGLREKVETKIKELMELDIIEPVEHSTAWVSPVVIVPKPNDDIRSCIDMRRVNEAIQRERHPIPTVEEVLQELTASKIFSKIDLKWGYHQLELDANSRDVTTFVTHCGLYRYKRLLFGINAAPEIYQYEIHRVIQGIPGVANISDDIIVHARSREEHDVRLRAVLAKLGEAGLTVNAQKCKFGVTELDFMGHRLTSEGLNPAKAKVEAVANAREPQNETEMRSFLGLVNYCAKLIPNFATLSDPLRKLTRKDVPFEFGPEQRKAFNALTDALVSAETLGYYDPKAQTKVIADASPVGLGAVLVQIHAEGPRIIAYASKALTDVERRYSQTEKEALGLVWACERFHPYLFGIEFQLVTDHKPLEVIYSPRSKPCARIERWVLRLQQYKYKVMHVPGKMNIADSLSRLLSGDSSSSKLETEAESFVRFIAMQSTPGAVTTREVERESEHDQELREIRNCIQSGLWDQCSHKSYVPIKDELCVVGQCVLRGSRLVIPSTLRPRIVSLAHEGHLGIVGTKQNLRTKVWWPGCEKEAEKFVKTCHGCQITSRGNPPEPIRTTQLPTGPWVDVAVDFLGPLPSGESILVIIDYYSRYYEYVIMRSTTSDKTVAALMEVFARHGLPQTLHSDNGPQFVSQVFADYMRATGVHHHRVTPKWPQANGEVERQNQSLEKRMRIAHSEGKNWKEALLVYVAAYRATPHSTTGKSPAELLFGRKIRTKLPVASESLNDQELRDRDAEMKGKMKLYADARRGAKHSDVVPGDEVLVRREVASKMDTPFIPQPYTVVSRQGNMVTVRSPEGVMYDRNTSHVKRYNHQRAETGLSQPNVDLDVQLTAESGVDTIDRHQDEGTDHPTEVSSSNQPLDLASSRPKRHRQKPKRLSDYVLE